jgi:four helix bundle protein
MVASVAANQMQVKSYQQLIAWQQAIALVTDIYSITSTFPRDEIYGLTSQLRRAAVSVPSNIAEGQGRATRGEFVQFLCHARGSLYEVETQIVVGTNLGYITYEQQQSLALRVSELGRILNGLITSLQKADHSQFCLATSHWPLATFVTRRHFCRSQDLTFRG